MTPAKLPVLLFNDECGVCRWIARWVKKSATTRTGAMRLDVRPIGDDPAALSLLSPHLDIWDAYATIHLLMPDGSMKLGGDAVAEVFRRLPSTRWFAWTFKLGFGTFRPFQLVLDAAYTILADVRPAFGCESCGTPSVWMKPLSWCVKQLKRLFGHAAQPTPHPSTSYKRATPSAQPAA